MKLGEFLVNNKETVLIDSSYGTPKGTLTTGLDYLNSLKEECLILDKLNDWFVFKTFDYLDTEVIFKDKKLYFKDSYPYGILFVIVE